MRLDRRDGGRGLFAALSVLAALALIVEGLTALLLAHGETIALDFGSAVAAAAPGAAPGPAAPAEPSAVSSGQREVAVGSSRREAASAGQRPPRPRISLAPPRLALWPTPSAPSPPPAPVPATSNGDEGHASAVFLDRYLEQNDSPLVGLGTEFWGRGRQYNVDPRLLVAIAGAETGFGRILTSRYNPFNWFYRGTWDSHFASWPEAIEVVARGIRRHYLDEGRTTVATLGAKYGPIGAANDLLNLNVNFVPNVTAFLRQMGGDPEHLTFE